MADNDSDDDVKVYAPNRALQTKIGTTNLDQILTAQIVESAQSVIQGAADAFLDECLKLIDTLEAANKELQQNPGAGVATMPRLIALAFSIKSKAGIGGYDLVSALAKALQLHGEKLGDQAPEAKDLQIIQWHVATIRQLLKNRVKGTGGEIGIAIMREIERLSG